MSHYVGNSNMHIVPLDDRRTGRSTRMMRDALTRAIEGKVVLIVVVNNQHMKELRAILLYALSRHALQEAVVVTNKIVHCGKGRIFFIRFDDINFIRELGIIRGQRTDETFWDHYIIEHMQRSIYEA